MPIISNGATKTDFHDDMDELPRWLVRIRRVVDQAPVGVGVYCGGHHVLTCAHVVADSVADSPPVDAVYVDFQYVKQSKPASAVVLPTGWYPPRPDGSGDIAVLVMDTTPPDARPAVFGPTYSGVSNHRFRVHGYPRGHERDGVLAIGIIVGLAGPGFLQLQMDSSLGYAIESGFSGAPVWDVDTETVVGIVATRDRVRADGTDPRTGYAIPSETLKASWPGTPWAPVVTPDGDSAHLQALLKIHRRNVQNLEKQEASYGGMAPVHIIGQLDDERARIAELTRRLGIERHNG
jgi:hypothetical protein